MARSILYLRSCMTNMIEHITIVTTYDSPRLRYACQHIFSDYLGLSWEITSDTSAGIPAIYYGSISSEGRLSIPHHAIISQIGIENQNLGFETIDELQYAFEVEGSNQYSLPFDLFGFVFYLLSRYEEYDLVDLDQHGRFRSKNSVAVKHGFVRQALIDRWILRLSQMIEKEYGRGIKNNNTFAIAPSIDIDMPFAYKYKGWKAYLGIFRDVVTGNLGGVQDRIGYWLFGVDPFETYEEMRTLLEDFNNVHCFLLQRSEPPHDLNHIAGTDHWKSIMYRINQWTKLGVHPSYASHGDIDQLRRELNHVQNIAGPVTMSRQHFLKMSMPDTYKMLLALDIKEDHSMIYADEVGFRASTAVPFRWYDLEAEETTDLWIYPYIVMDATLKHYLKLSPAGAIQLILKLKEEAKAVHGRFGYIWHNSSLARAYGWWPWRKVFTALNEPLEDANN